MIFEWNRHYAMIFFRESEQLIRHATSSDVGSRKVETGREEVIDLIGRAGIEGRLESGSHSDESDGDSTEMPARTFGHCSPDYRGCSG